MVENKKRLASRTALLGAAGALALSGAVAGGIVVPHTAYADAQPQAQQADSNSRVLTVNPTSFADVVEHVRNAVVSVKVKMTESAEASEEGDSESPQMPQLKPGDPLERFFKQFGQRGGKLHQQQKPKMTQAQGSGFFITADGYLVTNNHVVEHATDVQVVTDDGTVLPAKVIGTDKKTDLALLKVTKPGSYPFVHWAEKAPRVGDWVIAVGNPFGLGGTVTAGIVSARGRDIGAGPYDDFLQIDAPVNRGNSGGPTFNAAGNVVGVNTAIFSPSGGSVGIGFAIPSEVAQTVIHDLQTKGSVARGWIGVQIQPVTDEIAESARPEGRPRGPSSPSRRTGRSGPASTAGIKSGDVIHGGRTTRPVDGPKRAVAQDRGPRTRTSQGGPHRSTITATRRTVDVTLGTLPNSDQQAKADIAEATSRTIPPRRSCRRVRPAPSPRPPRSPGAGSSGVVVADIDPGRHRGPEGPPDRRRDPRSRRQGGVEAFGRDRPSVIADGQEGRPQGGAAPRQERAGHPFRGALHEREGRLTLRSRATGCGTPLPQPRVRSCRPASCRPARFQGCRYMSPMRMLIVEDDTEAAQYLAKAFREAGHLADLAADGLSGYDMARDGTYDVLIIDRMLPKMDGLSLIGGLRAQKVATPVLILSALGQVDDRVKGLRAGGDDYLPKPYAFSELLARVEVLSRRKGNGHGEETVYRVGGLELDRLAHKLTRDGREIVLQPREYRLLEYLMKHHGQVVTRTMLLENVWDYHFDPQTNVIDVHISRLRAKIDKGFDTPLLQTVRGAGYTIRDAVRI